MNSRKRQPSIYRCFVKTNAGILVFGRQQDEQLDSMTSRRGALQLCPCFSFSFYSQLSQGRKGWMLLISWVLAERLDNNCSSVYCTTWAFNALHSLHCLFIVTSPHCTLLSTLSPSSTPSLLLPPLIYSVGSYSYNPALSLQRSPGLLPHPGIMSKCLISVKLWLMPSPVLCAPF